MLQYAPSTFTNSEFGSVTISNVQESTTTNPSQYSNSKLNDGEIAGIVVGSVVGWFVAMMLGVIITITLIKRTMRSQRSVGAAESSSPMSPGIAAPRGGGLFGGFRRKQNFQPVPLASTAI